MSPIVHMLSFFAEEDNYTTCCIKQVSPSVSGFKCVTGIDAITHNWYCSIITVD